MDTVVDQVCISCGSKAVPYKSFCLFCGDLLAQSAAKQVTLRKAIVHPVPPTETGREYAGFWLRVWAGMVDVSIETVAALLVTVLLDMLIRHYGRAYGLTPASSAFISGMSFILVLSVGAWLYCALAESSSYRATLGKWMMGLEVTTITGEQISFGTASVRHFMKFLSLFTVGIGFLMAAWTRHRQALHDMPTDCVVVRVPQKFPSVLG